MTLALALRGSNGLVLASDSRMSGNSSKDDSTKFIQVNRDIGVMTYGLAIPGNESVKKLRDSVNSKQLAHFSQIAEEAKMVFFQEYATFINENNDLNGQVLGFILAGYDSNESNQFKIFSYVSPHFEPEENNDVRAAQWHVSSIIADYIQYPHMTVEQLKELAVIMMIHTSSLSNGVGGPTQLATVTYDRGFRQLHQDEVSNIVERVQPKIMELRCTLMDTFEGLLISTTEEESK